MDRIGADVGDFGSDTQPQIVAQPFIASEIIQRPDIAVRREKLAKVIENQIVPRLLSLHSENRSKAVYDKLPTQHDIQALAKLVLDPNIAVSWAFIDELRAQGLSMDGLFVGLLEPTARYLGTMWEHDECDFIEVTLGVGRLQQLLAMFSRSISVPAFSEKRRVCMMTVVKEKHSFGIAMVERFLRAGGWQVRSERAVTVDQVPSIVGDEWFAVVGLTISSDYRIDDLTATIQSIRAHSHNPTVGIMVGGPPFWDRPELAAQVGADATAINAPTAVLLAQRLFDIGVRGRANQRAAGNGVAAALKRSPSGAA